MTFMLNLAGSLIVAVVTAVVTVKLALRRLRSERWWERKANAYSSIIESLHVMKRAKVRWLENPDRTKDKERERELLQQYRKAQDEVNKAVDMSSFLLSGEAAEVLRQFKIEFENAEEDALVDGQHLDNYGRVSGELSAIEHCIEKLPGIARKDLEIKRGPTHPSV